MNTNEMRQYVEDFGPGDLFFRLADLPVIKDDDVGERLSDASFNAYDQCLPHIQKVWEVLGFGDDDHPTFEEGSNVEEMFDAIFRSAFKLGWLSASP